MIQRIVLRGTRVYAISFLSTTRAFY